MSNQLLTISMITNTALPVLSNECVLTDKMNRQYSDEFARKDAKIGATVNVRRPPRYLGTFGPALNVEPSVETYVPVSLNYQFHVDVQFNTVNLLLDISQFKERFLQPACAAIGNRIDSDGAYFAMQNTALSNGTVGTSPTSFSTFAQARAIMANEGAPKGMTPTVVLDPISMASMSDGLKGLFNPQAQLSTNFETGMVARKTAGFDWFEDQNIPTWTTGAQGGTPVLAGATSTAGGTALLTSGWAQSGTFETSGWTNSTGVITVGDILQIKGVYPVNPQNRGQYGRALKQFVVIPPAGYAPMSGVAAAGGPQFAAATLANGTFNATTGVYTSGGGGLLTLYVKECLISGGQFQNASAAPVSPYTITVNGGTANASTVSPQGLAFYRDAYALAFADLPLPRTAVEASRAYDDELGLSIRIATQYTINNDAEPTRMDVLYGFSGLYTGLGMRIAC
ncbi:Major capsid protein Gp5 [uncultured Caudovirales phage]|uniref:Major capsid protein Gp5 n=1 Tax=uncultured Caudovirales phage TaxID=2100421 RepID=A0A6J7W9T8_9CAUD|nr:Major capsid protein Gp5 [uncultured Caudovirales phage]CAB5170456.1 Major capsid protein Gp5 [uncultured Caudovirales phage]